MLSATHPEPIEIIDYLLLTRADGRSMIAFERPLDNSRWAGEAVVDTRARTLTLTHASGQQVRFHDFRPGSGEVVSPLLLAESETGAKEPLFSQVDLVFR